MATQEVTQGFELPTVRQYSVFLANKVGRLHDLVEQFESAPDVDICSISILESSDHAIVRVIPTDAVMAENLFKDNDLSYTVVNLLVAVLDGDKTLATLCMSLLQAEVDIRFAYPLLPGKSDDPAIALSVDDYVFAGQVLLRRSFRLLGEADLKNFF